MGSRMRVYRFGADVGREEVMVSETTGYTIRLIPEEHWPDGARVLRMKAIMGGKLDGLI